MKNQQKINVMDEKRNSQLQKKIKRNWLSDHLKIAEFFAICRPGAVRIGID